MDRRAFLEGIVAGVGSGLIIKPTLGDVMAFAVNDRVALAKTARFTGVNPFGLHHDGYLYDDGGKPCGLVKAMRVVTGPGGRQQWEIEAWPLSDSGLLAYRR